MKIAKDLLEAEQPTIPQTATSINHEIVLSRCGGDQELLETLAGMFPEESDKLMTTLELARSDKKAKEVCLSAHTLKGLCGMFEATQAATAALELENAASAGALGTEAQVNTLRVELVRAVAAVKQLQAHPATELPAY